MTFPYDVVFERGAVGQALTALDGRFRKVNAALANMLGYEPREIEGRLYADFTHPDDGATSADAARALIEGADRVRFEKRYIAKDGRTVWVEVNGVALRDASGAAEAFVATMVNVTDRKLAEAALVATEARLREARAGLAQADRLSSMGMLAASVGHEINNSLSCVIYNLQSLAADVPGLAVNPAKCTPEVLEDVYTRLREALAGSNRIREIARALGTFSRVEDAAPSPVCLARAIEHALGMAQNEIKYRARVVRELDGTPEAMASEGKLAQVFLNLLINAAHAIPDGDVQKNQIRVRTWSEGASVFAEVSDTGTGILPEHRGRIFEPFFTTKPVGVGSGLGLSICKDIIDGFGGDIDCQSEIGSGTRFVVRLPAARDGHARPVPAAKAPARPQACGRVLVVDDEEDICTALRRLLGRQHEVVAAASGRQARALLERDRAFDVLLVDLMMPDLSGMDLHAWLKECGSPLADRVVFLSGGAFTPRAGEYVRSSGNLQLDKPFDADSTRRVVAELVWVAKGQA